MPANWLKETFEKGVEEIQKLAKTGSIKIDITNLKKKRDERVKLIGNKVLEMIRTGELKAETFEPDYSYILEMDKKIELKERELTEDGTAAYHEDRPAHSSSAQPAGPAQELTQLPAPAPAAVVKHDDEEDDKDPHEDYINRPG